MTQGDALAPLLQAFRAKPSRTWSLIVTIFGDVIAPRGGTVWLGTLLRLLAGLEIGEGVVRTAMSRLAADGWVERQRAGRNSFYRLSDKGRATFGPATRHIYNAAPRPWGGRFSAVLLDNGATRAALAGSGCGALAPGLWISPGQSIAAGDEALHFQIGGTPEELRALAARGWPLAALARDYEAFLAHFAPLQAALAQGAELDDLQALVARVLLIHEYRRVVLRDPVLPVGLLPANWPGQAARALCAQLYPALLPASERWVDANALDEHGASLPAATGLERRFVL
jgi:phenylacetic acid degradation operon negative regulatory protein